MVKKIIATILLVNLTINTSALAIEDEFVNKTLGYKNLQIQKTSQTLAEDDFASKLDKNFKTQKVSVTLLNDNLAEKLDNNLKITKVTPLDINDSFAENNKNISHHTPLKIEYNENLPEVESITLQNKKCKLINNLNTDLNKQSVEIHIVNPLTTRLNIDEGDIIKFKTINDIKIKNKVYPAGSDVTGRIETITKNYSLGVPADIIIGNFKMGNISLDGEIQKIGANRSLWVKPCSYFTVWFFGAGLLLLPIRGGHAKIKPEEKFTLYISS